MVLWTTQASSCGSGWPLQSYQDSDSSELEISATSTTRTTQSSGTVDTTWCSLPLSCTIESLLITLRSITSSPSRCSRDIKSQEVKFSMREKDTAISKREPSTSPTPTMCMSHWELMMTRSRDWRTMESSERGQQLSRSAIENVSCEHNLVQGTCNRNQLACLSYLNNSSNTISNPFLNYILAFLPLSYILSSH